jgi:hypothetical protein
LCKESAYLQSTRLENTCLVSKIAIGKQELFPESGGKKNVEKQELAPSSFSGEHSLASNKAGAFLP